jgi:DNA-binding transcriptional regulator YdaS (Cro superfamily)
MQALNNAISAAKGVGELARLIGVGQSAVSNWRARGGLVPVEHCAAIEVATAGAVTRRDLRPDDWHRIWPELVTDEFPAPEPTPAADAKAAA